eukprot:TRINITY_DN4904_c1_g1_i1.p1 TRINITY_DN4904_c1_g1~~TRINITY_DN4904_c1_g1_i1.p1  ORF type:complete len:339 (-),score=75.93 TRINITY_DN4904_c1_g1_i1:13-1029(-)
MVWITSFLCKNKITNQEILLIGDAHLEFPQLKMFEVQTKELVLNVIENFKPNVLMLELSKFHQDKIQYLNVNSALIQVPKQILSEREGDVDDNNENYEIIAIDPRVTNSKTPISSWVSLSVNQSHFQKTNVTYGEFYSIFTTAIDKSKQEKGMFKEYYRKLAKKIKLIISEFPEEIDHNLNLLDALNQYPSVKFNPKNNNHLILLQWSYEIEALIELQKKIEAGVEKILYFSGVNHTEHFALTLANFEEYEIFYNPNEYAVPKQFEMFKMFSQPTQLLQQHQDLKLSKSWNILDSPNGNDDDENNNNNNNDNNDPVNIDFIDDTNDLKSSFHNLSLST